MNLGESVSLISLISLLGLNESGFDEVKQTTALIRFYCRKNVTVQVMKSVPASSFKALLVCFKLKFVQTPLLPEIMLPCSS